MKLIKVDVQIVNSYKSPVPGIYTVNHKKVAEHL